MTIFAPQHRTSHPGLLSHLWVRWSEYPAQTGEVNSRDVTDFESDFKSFTFSQIWISRICRPVLYKIRIWFSF